MERVLDVSDLEPCEPLQQSIAVARALAPGEFLRVRHRREPLMLFPLLKDAGYAWRCVQRGEAVFDIYIWAERDAAAASAALAAMDGPCP